MADKMTTCPWERITDFDGWSEFDRFEQWLRDQIATKIAEEVPILKPYNEVGGLKEKWFRHNPSSQVWRLIWPEPPFAGLFEKVT